MRFGHNHPLRDFEHIARRIGQAFAEEQGYPTHSEQEYSIKPATDILEDENNIYFQVELPGVKKEGSKLSISDDNILTISANKEQNLPEGVNVCCRQERKFGNFQRSFKLPDGLDTDKIFAKFDSGVLNITIAKKVEVMPKENVINID